MKNMVLVSAAIGFAVWLVARDRANRPLTPRWSTRQRLTGTIDQVKGAGKRSAGRLTGNNALIAEGVVDQALGAVKRGVGKAVGAASSRVPR